MQVIKLAKRLPGNSDHEARLKHVQEKGHIIMISEDGVLKGYAELYILDDAPGFPAIPWPENVPGGEYLYCYAAVCERGYIKRLMDLAKRTFKVKYLCYHRHKKNNALHIERI